MSWENTEKYKTFYVPIEKEIRKKFIRIVMRILYPLLINKIYLWYKIYGKFIIKSC